MCACTRGVEGRSVVIVDEQIDTDMDENDRHCSYCKHFWSGHGQMYCTIRTQRITAKRRHGCSLFSSLYPTKTEKTLDKDKD